MISSQGRKRMSILEDTDLINAILADLAEQSILEPMAEPIDDPNCHPLDWAEVVGITNEIFDELYPDADAREMVDENGEVWYVS
jgi:hypothetical protein